MYITDQLSDDVKIYYSQETMNKASRMIVIDWDGHSIELYCPIEQAKKLANTLLEKINEFEAKYGK